jgi:hypothetical protein
MQSRSRFNLTSQPYQGSPRVSRKRALTALAAARHFGAALESSNGVWRPQNMRRKVLPGKNFARLDEAGGDAHMDLSMLLFFVTSVAIFGSRIRFLP